MDKFIEFAVACAFAEVVRLRADRRWLSEKISTIVKFVASHASTSIVT